MTALSGSRGRTMNETDAFQTRVGEWMKACFPSEVIGDKLERADRFIEEALELVQATGYSAYRAHALVDYTFNRPVGEAFQEVGGVTVTLAALCNPHGIDMDEAAETELARVWTKIEKIRAKQAAKPVGSALPSAIEAITRTDEVVRLREALERLACTVESQVTEDYYDRLEDALQVAWAALHRSEPDGE
jgi:hypothetical protein